MTDRPWMPFYVSDYLDKTLDLSVEEHGVYLLLLSLAWRRSDGGLPNDLPFLKRAVQACAAGFHGNKANKLIPKILARFFVLRGDGQWHQARVDEEIGKAAILSRNAREKAEKRWAAHNQINHLEMQRQCHNSTKIYSLPRGESEYGKNFPRGLPKKG